MQVFLVLRIIKCLLEASLCHFSCLSSIWQRYTKYLPLKNYIFHLSIQKKVCVFNYNIYKKFLHESKPVHFPLSGHLYDAYFKLT